MDRVLLGPLLVPTFVCYAPSGLDRARSSRGTRAFLSHGIVEPARGQPGLRGTAATRSGGLADRAGRARLPAGPQRRGQEHAAAALSRRASRPTRARSIRQQGLRIARLPQEVPEGRGGTVADEVAEGLEERGAATGVRLPGRRDPLADGPGRRRPVRGSLLGHEAARPAGQGPGRRARHPPARRADQPPRHRLDPLARRVPAPLRRHAGLRHPRPGVPGAAGHAGSSSSTGASSTTGPATTRPSSSARRSCSRPRSGRTPSSTRGWPRRRSGSARGSRRVGPATRAGSGR